jgi:SAM-dependent methyltransferase
MSLFVGHPEAMAADELRAIFDEDAALYDQARPTNPSSLFRDLEELADIGPSARVVELGPGTGQATLALSAAGARVVAVELGPSLAARLRHKVAGLRVEVVVGAFEEWPLPNEPFDTVAAFTAWHWLTPGIRARKTYNALRPGGALATITTTHVLGGTEQFFADVQDCFVRWDRETESGFRLPPASEVPAAIDEVDASDLFEPAARRHHRQDIRYTTQEYLDLLRTYSTSRKLPPDLLTGLLGCIGQLIDSRYSGEITKRYLYELRVARRRP